MPVRYSYASLVAANASLGTAIARANRGTAQGLGAALLVDRNQVELLLPLGQRLTPTQQTLVDAAKQHLGLALALGWWQGQIRRNTCAFSSKGSVDTFDCDPPLRGGVGLYHNVSSGKILCTAAFYAKSRSDGKPFIMTAGHCGVSGTGWSAFQPRDGTFHVVGPMHHSKDAGNDDYGIIAINNPSGWNPQPWVYVHASSSTTKNESYPINGDATSPVGTRVCMSGTISKTSCAPVEKVGIGATGADPLGLAQADLCAVKGDSGSPIYSSKLARGILKGQVTGTPHCQDALFQGIREAEKELNVNVVFAS